MYDFYFLRHGRSLADDEKKCEGRYDSPLTEIGIAQAEETARKFVESGIVFNDKATLLSVKSEKVNQSPFSNIAFL